MAQNKSPLDDPEQAAYAWARFRRLMRFMFMLTVGVVAIALALLLMFLPWGAAELRH